MAVRDGSDPWVAGEVLQAADLNQTFASKLPYSFGTATPSTTDSGFLWYDSNSTPAAPKFWDGSAFATLAPAPGLELITSEVFSAVSSVSVNGCFTSAFVNYRIVLGLFAATTGINNWIRFRSSGADQTATNYRWSRLAVPTTGSLTNEGSGSDSVIVYSRTSDANDTAVLEVYSPAVAGAKTGLASGPFAENSATFHSGFTAGIYNATGAFDGFTLSRDSGTMTGTLRVYGYED
jgi:hypothetical protein